MTEDKFGKRGFVTFEFYSGEGRNLRDCRPNLALRCALTLLTAVDAPLELVHQVSRIKPPLLTTGIGLSGRKRD
jgi:hypothetical protein